MPKHIRLYGDWMLCDLVFKTQPINHSRSADVLHLLGRQKGISSETRRRLVKTGLDSPSVELRDAAAQAAELWEDRALITELTNHHETTPWLADYIAGVIHDLEG